MNKDTKRIEFPKDVYQHKDLKKMPTPTPYQHTDLINRLLLFIA